MRISKAKFLLLGGLGLVLAALAFLSQRKPPVLEEKFVIEKTPAPAEEPIPAVVLSQPGERVLLHQAKITYQTFNNCGPATLSMILSFYNIHKSQRELADLMRPYQNPKGDNDDKAIFPQEFVDWTQNFGLKAIHRPGGSIELLKLLTTNGIPVVVKTWLRPNEDIGHFRIVRGFEEKSQVIIEDDSYFGPNRRISYFQFLEMWQPFNYGYIPVYPAQKEELVKAILGEDEDIKIAYRKAAERAKKEIEFAPKSVYPIFNLSTSYYHLGEYEKSVAEFEKVEARLPRRMLWYQIEPILAYFELARNKLVYKELKNYARVFQISEWLFAHGNRAFSELYQIRGEIYLEKGDKEAARREFELASKYNKNFQPAKDALDRYYSLK